VPANSGTGVAAAVGWATVGFGVDEADGVGTSVVAVAACVGTSAGDVDAAHQSVLDLLNCSKLSGNFYDHIIGESCRMSDKTHWVPRVCMRELRLVSRLERCELNYPLIGNFPGGQIDRESTVPFHAILVTVYNHPGAIQKVEVACGLET